VKQARRMQSTLLYKGKPTKLRAGDKIIYDREQQILSFIRGIKYMRLGPRSSGENPPDRRMIFPMAKKEVPKMTAFYLQQLFCCITGCEASVLRCDERNEGRCIIIQLHKPKKGTVA